jgi:hypothetical protein
MGKSLYITGGKTVFWQAQETLLNTPRSVSEGQKWYVSPFFCQKKGRDFSLPDEKHFTQGPVRMGNGRAFVQADGPLILSFARIL